ncbi:SsrA-binding protein SmpB [Cerasicoccus arenae]|uniref:SsrA-binding protein n=1 Tax=Cerasicoccus arenae TaxID=424488 RepID=A0A8J3DM87_9BACT|nr:SsrA-binding protein SmpB [Cerasicoccus arenae]GHC10373.1 SsrA-binding protein [Cerasicoccus arenae]
MAKKKKDDHIRELRNGKAFHNYFVGDKFEAGIKLTGPEVKSIRAGKGQITESFVRIDSDGVPTLYHAYIDEFVFDNTGTHNPTRARKLLLHKKEISRIKQEMEAGGQALIPLRLYFKQALIKVEIALCKGKQLHDKRQSLKKKEQLREADRAVSFRR